MNSSPRSGCSSAHGLACRLPDRLRLLAVLAIHAMSAWGLSAQPAPILTSISPNRVVRGALVVLELEGKNLGGLRNVLIQGNAGVTVNRRFNLKGGKPALHLRVESDATLSPAQIRVVGAGGVSNAVSLSVIPWPEHNEVEPNNTSDQAMKLKLPTVVRGAIHETGEVDVFRIAGSRGQVLVADISAHRLEYPLDATLSLLNSEGQEVASSEDVYGFDPLLLFKLPVDGEYFLRLWDDQIQGSDRHQYLLRIGYVPHVESVYPLGAQRGKPVQLELTGANLGTTSRVRLNLPSGAPLGLQELRVRTENGLSNVFPFHVSDAPEIHEQEPNDRIRQAQFLSVSKIMNGRIGQPGDVDFFRFKPDSGRARWVVEVSAQRLGSPLDSLLELREIDGTVLSHNDDTQDKDARIDYDEFVEGRDYIIALRDLLDRGGNGFTYRLSVHPPDPPEYVVSFSPDVLRVHCGGRVPIRCELSQPGKIKDTVIFSATGLPQGVSSTPLTLQPGGKSWGWLFIEASDRAAIATVPLAVSARTGHGQGSHVRLADPDSEDGRAFLSILDRLPFEVTPLIDRAVVHQEGKVKVDILVLRRPGFTGDVKLVSEELGPAALCLASDDHLVKGTETQATMVFEASLDTEPGDHQITVRGEATVKGHLETQYIPPLTIRVKGVPFVFAPMRTRLSVTAVPDDSPSAARQSDLRVNIERRSKFGGQIDLGIEGLPAGIQSEVSPIPGNQNESIIRLTASERTQSGKKYALWILATTEFNGRRYRRRLSVELAVNAPRKYVTPPPLAVGEK